MINKLIDAGKKENIKIEVVTLEKEKTFIETLNDKVTKTEISNLTTYNIKAIYGKKSVKIDTENIEDIDSIIKNLKINLELIDNVDEDEFASISIKNEKAIEYVNLDIKKVKNNLLSIDEFRKNDKDIKSIIVGYSFCHEKYTITNEKVLSKDEVLYHSYYSELTIEKDNEVKTTFFNKVGVNDCFDGFKNMFSEKITDLKLKINSQSCETSRYNIVLSNNCVSDILSRYGEMFDAESIYKRLSPLKDKYNEKIFSNVINIVEDPTNVNYIGKRLFDTEGTKTYYKTVIENGIFKAKLYNNKYAKKDNVKSTGNAFGVRNMYIMPGEFSKEELLNEYEECIYIDDLQGIHSGANYETGEMSLQAQGYTIKNGKKVNGLNMIILTTNIFELFNNVLKVGNDLELFDKNFGAPSLLVKDIAISGNK